MYILPISYQQSAVSDQLLASVAAVIVSAID